MKAHRSRLAAIFAVFLAAAPLLPWALPLALVQGCENLSQGQDDPDEGVVAVPAPAPAPGAVPPGTTVTLSTATAGAVIYYTTDNSEPALGAGATQYGNSVTVTQALTIKAIAVKQGMKNSGVLEAVYTLSTEAPPEHETEDPPGNETEDPSGNETEEAVPEFSFRGTALTEDGALAGEKAGDLDAGSEGGALTYTLAAGEGDGDNAAFEIRGNEVFIRAASLGMGEYRFRVRAANGAGGSRETAFTWTVGAASTLAAPSGIRAVPGMGRLSVSWQPVEGAASYQAYYAEGAGAAFSGAARFSGASEANSLTITGLADSTVYTVWVRAGDAAGKFGAPSGPLSCRKTSDPVNPLWYSGDFDYWESETDGYEITATSLDYNTMSPWNTDGMIGGFGYKSDIRYYVEFDPAEVAEKAPKQQGKPKTDTGKWGEDLRGHPVGVFIVEYREDYKPAGRPGNFFGVYFYGLGAVQTNSSSALTVNHGGDLLAYLGNSIGLSEVQGGPSGVTQQWDPETTTLEAAIERFTLENMGQFIAFVATPWYRLKGAFTNDGKNDEQWLKGGAAPENPGTALYRVDSLDAMGALLEGLPQNSRETAYRVALSGVDVSRLADAEAIPPPVPDGFKPLYDALRGRYAALDLDGCTGATLAYFDRMNQDYSQRRDQDKLVSLVLPSGTRRVGFRAFQNCRSLESVVMPSGLESIGQYAFAGCVSLTAVELPASLTRIEFAAFQGCGALSLCVIHAETPPDMLSGGIDDWFSNVSGDFVIRAPPGSVGAYKNADGWRRYAERIKGI